MPTAPTSSEFKTRYPAFAGVADAIVDDVLSEAAGRVGDDWITTDQRPAMMAWAAHSLTMEGFGAQSVTVGSQTLQIAGEVDRITVDDVTTSFGGKTRANVSVTAKDDPLSETPFGRRFLEIRRRNSPGVAVITE